MDHVAFSLDEDGAAVVVAAVAIRRDRDDCAAADTGKPWQTLWKISVQWR